jgi:peptide/nickel transport system substrate-binding protein
VPVTTEDVLFAYEDVLLNDKLTPVFPEWLRAGGRSRGEPLKLEVVDKYTFRISFAESYGRFPVQLALTGWRGYTDLLKPKHYLRQFHIRYTPLEKLEPEIQKAALAKGEWWTLFTQKDHINWELTRRTAIGFPVLYPWVMVESSPTVTLLERNPYYFKVDAAGNQLPYIDRYRMELVADVEVSTIKVLAGEVDFLREDTALNKLPVYKENAKKGGYRIALLGQHVDPTAVWLNLTHPDPVWRQVVRDVRFRKALSMGINYKEIIEAIYSGFGEPPTTVPGVYDPAAANKLLDEMGLNRRDAEGFRLGPDGKTFIIPFEVAMYAPDTVPVTEMVVENWKALGINTTMKTIEQGLRATRQGANEIKATVIWDVEPMWRTGGWLDFRPTVQWAPLWWQWYISGGKGGEEPPKEVKRILELSEKIMEVSPATPEDKKLFDEIYSILHDNVFFFITSQKSAYPLIASERLGNIPHAGFGIGANLSGEQFFFRQ